MYRTVFAISSGILMVGSLSYAGPTEDAKRLIEDIRVTAANVETRAGALERAARDTGVSRDTHYAELTDMREGINHIGRDVRVLDAEKESLVPWEQEALAKAMPLLLDAAGSANQAIALYKQNISHLWSSNAYFDDVDKVSRDSGRVAKTLDAYLKLDQAAREQTNARERLNDLSGGR